MTYFSKSIEEAMSKVLECNYQFHLWVTPGVPIEINFFTGKSNIIYTYLSKNFNRYENKYYLGVIIKENDLIFMEELGREFSSLGELRKVHPQLFEVKGTLYTFP